MIHQRQSQALVDNVARNDGTRTAGGITGTTLEEFEGRFHAVEDDCWLSCRIEVHDLA